VDGAVIVLRDVLDYGARVLPGLVLIGVCYALARKGRDPMMRIMVLIFAFILIRDAMSPAGLWRFGGPVPWLRFTDQAGIMLGLGAAALAATAALMRLEGDLRALVRWGRPGPAAAGLGLGGGVLAAAPVLAISAPVPITERGGTVALSLLPALLVFCLAGNLAEEVLFRGVLQGYLEPRLGAVRAALLSGLLFAACHVFLASTVTGAGWPLLAFTLWEGLICAFLRMRAGVLPAALAHGTAIFLLACGLV